jgi:hypothetical protein
MLSFCPFWQAPGRTVPVAVAVRFPVTVTELPQRGSRGLQAIQKGIDMQRISGRISLKGPQGIVVRDVSTRQTAIVPTDVEESFCEGRIILRRWAPMGVTLGMRSR